MAPRRSKSRIAIVTIAAILCGYGLLAYTVLPLAWKALPEHQKALAGLSYGDAATARHSG